MNGSVLYKLHYPLRNRVILDLSFVAETPFHIGYKSEGTIKEILTMRVGDRNVPVIPAESVKGSLRALATRLAKKVFLSENADVDELTRLAVEKHEKDKHKIEEEEKKKIEAYADELINQLKNDKVFTQEEVEEDWRFIERKLELLLSMHCPICRLFGSKFFAGKMNFSDILIDGDYTLRSYTSASINRKTRVAQEKQLFTVLSVHPSKNAPIKLRIIIDNLEFNSHEGSLLKVILKYISKIGLRLGGIKSKGYGTLLLNNMKSKALVLMFDKGETEEVQLANIHTLLLNEKYLTVLSLDDFLAH